MHCSTIPSKHNLFINKRFVLAIIFSLILVAFHDVFAGASEDVLGKRLCNILAIVMGPTAKAIATIAIIFVAIGLFAGRMTWLTAIPIIMGIIIIFSAPALVQFISGNNNSECTDNG